MLRRGALGFTILELMIVVTVIGILAAIAIPAYLNYLSRAKVVEASQLIGPVKTAVQDRFLHAGVLPDDNASANLAAPNELGGRYVSSIEVRAGGVVTIAFGDAALRGATVTWTPLVSGTSLDWVCTTTLPHDLIPKDC